MQTRDPQTAAPKTRRFVFVESGDDGPMYEVHKATCRARHQKAMPFRTDEDHIHAEAEDVQTAVKEISDWLEGDWGYTPADSNFYVHGCAR